MEENNTYKPLVISKTNSIYQYNGNEEYKNITANRIGNVPDEKAKTIFTIPPTLNIICEMNPNVVDLISKLGLGYGGAFEYKG